MLCEGIQPHQFHSGILGNGGPSFLSSEGLSTIVDAAAVADHCGAPFFASEIDNAMIRIHASENGLEISEVKTPSLSTLRRHRKGKFPFRQARKTRDGEIRRIKSIPKYLNEFFALLGDLHKKHNFSPSHMYVFFLSCFNSHSSFFLFFLLTPTSSVGMLMKWESKSSKIERKWQPHGKTSGPKLASWSISH